MDLDRLVVPNRSGRTSYEMVDVGSHALRFDFRRHLATIVAESLLALGFRRPMARSSIPRNDGPRAPATPEMQRPCSAAFSSIGDEAFAAAGIGRLVTAFARSSIPMCV